MAPFFLSINENDYHLRAIITELLRSYHISYHRVMRIIRIYQNLDLDQEYVKNILDTPCQQCIIITIKDDTTIIPTVT